MTAPETTDDQSGPTGAPGRLLVGVGKTLRGLSLTPADQARYSAAARLCRVYAQAIDEDIAAGSWEALDKLGPKLLAALIALGAVPTVTAGGTANGTDPVTAEFNRAREEYTRLRAAGGSGLHTAPTGTDA